MVWIHISTWIAGIYDYNRDRVMIRHVSDCIEINLPSLVRKKIKIASFDVSEWGAKAVDRKTWPRQQDVTTGTSQDG